ncbi:hypothetical protein ABVT39_028380 [Epinephelus coioides]
MIDVLSTLIFLCVVFVLYADTGVTSQPITAVEGDNVTLQCPLAHGVDLSAYTVDVSRLDLNVSDNDVHVYRNGQDHLRPQMAQYKKRTTLIHEDLTRGILTLIISSVKLSDNGRYKVYVTKRNAGCVIDLSVVPKDDSSTTKPPVEGVTEPDDRDGGNRRTVGAAIVLAVFVIFCIFTALILNGKKIKNCMRMIKGGRESTVPNTTKWTPVRTTQD